jgi:hypothetical protein
LSSEQKAKGVLPAALARVGPLETLAHVRTEMARVYRLAASGRLDAGEMTKFVYALKEIRGVIEAAEMIEIERRLAALESLVPGERRPFASAEARH